MDNNSHLIFKQHLESIAKSTKPSLGTVLNLGIAEVKNSLYSYTIVNNIRGTRKVSVAKYLNPVYIDTNKISKNYFVFTGSLISTNTYGGRTYISVQQSTYHAQGINSLCDLKCVIDDVIDLQEYLNKSCILAGYLFPEPLGSKGLAIGGCCEVLKFDDELIYNNTTSNS